MSAYAKVIEEHNTNETDRKKILNENLFIIHWNFFFWEGKTKPICVHMQMHYSLLHVKCKCKSRKRSLLAINQDNFILVQISLIIARTLKDLHDGDGNQCKPAKYCLQFSIHYNAISFIEGQHRTDCVASIQQIMIKSMIFDAHDSRGPLITIRFN